jgi:hypothetical protein
LWGKSGVLPKPVSQTTLVKQTRMTRTNRTVVFLFISNVLLTALKRVRRFPNGYKGSAGFSVRLDDHITAAGFELHKLLPHVRAIGDSLPMSF